MCGACPEFEFRAIVTSSMLYADEWRCFVFNGYTLDIDI